MLNEFLTAPRPVHVQQFFLKKLLKKGIAHIFVLLLAPFASKLVNYSRHAQRSVKVILWALWSDTCYQILTNLVSNEGLKPQGYRFDEFFWNLFSLMGEISIWRWKSLMYKDSLFFDKKYSMNKYKEMSTNNRILGHVFLKNDVWSTRKANFDYNFHSIHL